MTKAPKGFRKQGGVSFKGHKLTVCNKNNSLDQLLIFTHPNGEKIERQVLGGGIDKNNAGTVLISYVEEELC